MRDPSSLLHADITDRVLGAFFQVYAELGYGFLEAVYETAMAIALRDLGATVERQLPVSVFFRGERAGDFRADLLVEGSVVVEIKACRTIERAHEAQLLNYLRATRLETGLLLNFGPRAAFKRLVFANDRKVAVPAAGEERHEAADERQLPG